MIMAKHLMHVIAGQEQKGNLSLDLLRPHHASFHVATRPALPRPAHPLTIDTPASRANAVKYLLKLSGPRGPMRRRQ